MVKLKQIIMVLVLLGATIGLATAPASAHNRNQNRCERFRDNNRCCRMIIHQKRCDKEKNWNWNRNRNRCCNSNMNWSSWNWNNWSWNR